MPLVRTDTPQPPPTFPTPAAAWDYLKHLLDVVFSLFGAPARLAALGGVSLEHRADISSWLRPLERLARLLLLAEAAEIAFVKPRRAPKHRTYVFPGPDLSAKNSEHWRVSFMVLRANSKRGSGSKGYWIPSISAQPLARRFEALARVVLDPLPYARRLARRLDRRRNPRAIRALLAPVRTELAPLMRMIEMAAPLLGAIRFRFSSA